MLMANNKMYENYLMHYRTPGSKNGYTKYPDKYTPVGEKASMNQNIYAGPAATAGFGKGVYGAHKIQNLYNAPARTVNASAAGLRRQKLHQNTRVAQKTSEERSKLGPLRSAILESAVGGFYDKRTGKSWDIESAARAMIDPRYKQELQDNSAFSLKRQIKNSSAGQIAADIADRAKRGASNAKDFGGFMAKDIASRAKSAAKKGRDFTDFVVEDNIDRAKKLVGKGKEKVSKLLKKFF